MRLALDPYMIRETTTLESLPGVVADLGYEWIELSPREDFTPFFTHPRIDDAGALAFRKALSAAGVGVASILPLYRWAGPDEDARQAAVRYWKRAIRLASLLGVDTMNSEFNGNPREADVCEAQFWRSMEELLPEFEKEGIRLVLEPHPDDFEEDGKRAIDLVRAVNSPNVSFLYCTPHTFHQGNDVDGILDKAGSLTTMCHVADAYDHTASSGLRYIVNPPGIYAGSRARSLSSPAPARASAGPPPSGSPAEGAASSATTSTATGLAETAEPIAARPGERSRPGSATSPAATSARRRGRGRRALRAARRARATWPASPPAAHVLDDRREAATGG